MARDLTLTSATFNASGKFGQSLSAGYGIVTSNGLSGTQLSMAGWVKANASTGSICVAFGQGDVAWVGMDASGKIVGHFGKSPDVAITPNLVIADGAWHYVELCVDSTTGSYLFVDGALVGSNATASAFDFTTSPYRFGVRILPYGPSSSPSTGFQWPGEIDDVAVYSAVRHNAAYTAPTAAESNTAPNLQLLYHLDGNGTNSQGLTVPDAPTIGTATAGDGTVSVTFTAAGTNTAATSFKLSVYKASDNSLIGTATGSTSPIAYSGLTNGSAVYGKVSGINGQGEGAQSAASNSATPTAAATPVAVAISDVKLDWSPYNWDTLASYKSSNNPGAYVKMAFTGTSVSIGVDVSAMSGASLPAASYPIIRTVIDGAVFSDTQLASGTTSVSRTGLASGAHTVEVYFKAADINNGERWTTPVNAIRITGFTLDTGAAVTAWPTLTDAMLFYGDSVNEGYLAEGTTTAQPAGNNGLMPVGQSIAQAFGCEVGMVAYSGQGYQQSGNGGVPSVLPAWNLFSAGRSRLVNGLLTPAPKYICIEHGANGTTTAANIQTLLTALRTAAPSAKIFQFVPRGGYARTAITSGVQAQNDANVFLIDLGTGYQAGLSLFTNVENMFSLDGLHPKPLANARAAAGFARKMQLALDGVAAPTLTARTVTVTLNTDSVTPAANLTGLSVSFHDEAAPGLFSAPRYKSTTQTTNSSGVLTFSVQSTLASGGTGHLTVLGATGLHYNATVTVA